jgi:outer membrane protein assembly factor BamB
MKIVLVAALLAAAAGAVVQPASAKDPASSFQIDAAHDGQIRFETAFQAPLKRKWVKDVGGTVSSPVYGDGLVFVTAYVQSSWVLFALDARKGKIAWQQNTSGGVPAYANGRVFVVSFGGLLQAYNAKHGSLEWSQQQQDQYAFFDPPTTSGGSIYLTGAGSGVTLYAVQGKHGKSLWTQFGPAGDSNPAVGGGNVYVAYPCNDYAFKQKDGSSLWAYETGCDGGGGGTPVYFDNRVYINDGIDNVVLDAQTGAVVRPFPAPEFVPAFWTPVSGSPLGVVVDGSGTLSAFDPATGNSVWTVQPESFSTPPLVINDTVILGDFNGNLHAFEAQTGVETWSASAGTASISAMSAGDGMLFVPMGTQLSAWVPK